MHAARSCEWEVGTEWEEKSCFSETINAEAQLKGSHASPARLCSLHSDERGEVGDGGERGLLCAPAIVRAECVNQNEFLINLFTHVTQN